MCDVVRLLWLCGFFFFFKQKTAYEMRISDWSSDVCSSDLGVDDTDHLYGVTGELEYAVNRRVAVAGIARFSKRDSSVPLDEFDRVRGRSEEHTSELQSLMRISYAVFCLKKKTQSISYTNFFLQQKKHKTQTRRDTCSKKVKISNTYYQTI